MLKKLKVEGIKFPNLYIAENNEDVEIAKSNGVPYIKWKWGQDKLIKTLLRPTLEKMFPGINWSKVLGRRRSVKSCIVMQPGCSNPELETEVADYDKEAMLKAQHNKDKKPEEPGYLDEDAEYSREVPIAIDNRQCSGGFGYDNYDRFNYEPCSIDDYIGDLSSSVNIETLQSLALLPQFMGDIVDCIKLNLSQSMHWTEGYTKKLGVPLGNFNNNKVLPNLIIIDVSASIPDGIAATMLTLADTLRSQCNAELIITSCRSGYYAPGDELPSPSTLRKYYGRGNESKEFMAILEKHIAGREFGHVICFGDNDNPGSYKHHYISAISNAQSISLIGTKVHAVHYYHTYQPDQSTGYARWVEECCPNVEKHYDTSWCEIMNKHYKL